MGGWVGEREGEREEENVPKQSEVEDDHGEELEGEVNVLLEVDVVGTAEEDAPGHVDDSQDDRQFHLKGWVGGWVGG